MKKLISTGLALLFIAVHSFGQDATPKSTTTKHTTSTHKHKSHKSTKHHSASSKSSKTNHTAMAAPSEGATMNPTSGSASNGAGKSARIQTTTKEKADNLNDMDKSRN